MNKMSSVAFLFSYDNTQTNIFLCIECEAKKSYL